MFEKGVLKGCIKGCVLKGVYERGVLKGVYSCVFTRRFLKVFFTFFEGTILPYFTLLVQLIAYSPRSLVFKDMY